MQLVMRFTAAAALCICAPSAGAAKLKVPQQFATIQAAIDAAAVGDTVIVAPGNYPENVILDVALLTLRGKGATIDGNGDHCLVVGGATGATVDGLTLRNAGNEPALLVGLSIGVTVKNCTVRDTGMTGISVQVCQGVEVRDNRVIDAGGIGIEVISDHVLVRDNVVQRTGSGIVLAGSFNALVGNRVKETGNAIAVGDAGITDTSDVVAADNDLRTCADAILVRDADDLYIAGNAVRDTSDEGLDVMVCNRLIADRNVFKNTMEEAVELSGVCVDVVIERNKCFGSLGNGMHLSSAASSGAFLRANTVKGSAEVGIDIESDDNALVANKVTGSLEFDLQDDGMNNVFIANVFGTVAP